MSAVQRGRCETANMDLLASICWIFILKSTVSAGQYQELSMTPIWLTVTALKGDTSQPELRQVDRALQLNWMQPVEEVALFTSDPDFNSTPDIRVKTSDWPMGMYQTNLSVGRPELPGGWGLGDSGEPAVGDHCLPFWIGSYNNGSVELIECLKIRPTWMADSREKIESLPITSVVWPGTHNSGCYPEIPSQVETLHFNKALGRYVLTQDEDIWTQLVLGVRYIDLRIGIYPVPLKGNKPIDIKNSFWVNHDMIKVRPLLPILQQIKKFVKQAQGEFVILDLHRFPVGFSNRHARHNRLVELLELMLKDLAVEFDGSWPTLQKLWQQDKRLIIAYGDNEVAKSKRWLWPPVRQQWGNQQSVSGLQDFLECCMNDTELREPRRGLWAAMGQLTPSQYDLLFNPRVSLGSMADVVNPHISRWLRRRWWDRANVVTTDFCRGNNVVEAAIVGYYTRKVLFIFVKNKYCTPCARAEQKKEPAKPHVCYKNWDHSSSAMEAVIIGEGFRSSERMYRAKYAWLIADGDSSVYTRLLEHRPYPNLQKTECKDQLLRN